MLSIVIIRRSIALGDSYVFGVWFDVLWVNCLHLSWERKREREKESEEGISYNYKCIYGNIVE